MLYFVEILRALATLLITNSHFKGVYPDDILSFGGGFGLSLFFTLSGYLLSKIDRNTLFIQWYPPKILRMYVPLWIYRLIEIFIGYRILTNFRQWFMLFIFPTYWFVGAMVLDYAIYFLLVKYIFGRYGRKSWFLSNCVLATIFLVLYITKSEIGTISLESLNVNNFKLETPYLIMQPIWLMCMLVGFGLRETKIVIEKEKKYVFLVILSIIVYFITKILVKGGSWSGIEFLLVFSYICFGYSVFCIFALHEPLCKKMADSKIGKILCLLSECSLEIYFVQFVLISQLNSIVFPLNLFVLLSMIIISAVILHKISCLIIIKITSLCH